MNNRYLKFNSISVIFCRLILFFIGINYIIPFQLYSITPAKWNYKDRLLLFPSKDIPKPKVEKVFDANGNLVLTSELVYKGDFLVEEIYTNPKGREGSTIYEYNTLNRLTKEITKDATGKITESKDYVYKGHHLTKIRFYTEGGTLYMESSIFQWLEDMVSSGEITWMETKDKEKIIITAENKKRIMTILDEKKNPIGIVEFLYNQKGQLEERRFTQGESFRKNLFVYDNQGRLKEFSFHVKQEGRWILEKIHNLEY